MAATYRPSWWRRAANALIRALLRAGLAPPHTYLLTVRGRKSGRLYFTPVTLVEEAGQRWIVAPDGEVNWVRNARSAGTVKLSCGRKSEVVKILELPPEAAAPVLKKYLESVPITRQFFDVSPHSSVDELIAEASRHPVFLATAAGEG